MITAEKKEMLKYYNLGLMAYKQRKWEEAIKAFDMALKVIPQDGPSKLYYERANEYKLTPPPEDWDGVFTMTTK